MHTLTAFDILEYFTNTPQITFEITECCNLRCLYCGYGKLYADKDPRSGRNLPVKNAISFLSFLTSLWDKGFCTSKNRVIYFSFYGGEPTLNMSFVKDVIHYIEESMVRKYGIQAVFTMTTNALLLPKYIEYLKDKKFRLLISLDGDEDGDSYRMFPNGKPSYDIVLANIQKVRKKYPKYFNEYVNFNAVLNDRNSVYKIKKYFDETFHKKPSIGEINTYGINERELAQFKKIHQSKMDSEIEAFRMVDNDNFRENPEFDRVSRYLLQHSPYAYKDYNQLLLGKENEEWVPTGTCLPFSKKVFITVSGKILPCERISHKYYLGKVVDGKVELDFEAIAQKYNEYYKHINHRCSLCKSFKKCLCCMFYTGQLESKNASCRFFVNQKKANEELKYVYGFLKKYPEAYSYIMNSLKIF